MAKADGTIYIDTAIGTEGFKAGGKDIEAAARRMAKSVEGIGKTAEIAMQKQVNSFVKQNQAYAAQEQKVEALRAKLEELKNQKVETDEFKEIGKQIANDAAKLDRLQKAQETFLAAGGKSSSSAYRRREMEIEELRSSIEYAKGEQEELLSSGGAYQPVDTSATEDKLISEGQRLSQMQSSLQTVMDSMIQKVNQYGEQVVKEEERAEAARAREEARAEAQRQKLEELNQKFEETRAREVAAIMESERLEAIGRNAEVSRQDIVDLVAELERLRQRQVDLSKAGVGLGYEEFDQNASRIAEINSQLADYNSSLRESGEETEKFSSKQINLGNVFSRIGSSVKKLISKIIQLGKSTKKTNSSMGSSLKTVLKYSLGIRSLYTLFNRLRRAMKEGFGNLAQYSGKTNASISAIISALTRLKNSFATAFAPILDVVSPILTSFINMISRALTYIGMFMAALTGQKTFNKAIAVQEDFAAKLKDTAGATNQAAKEQKRYLSGLDEMRLFEIPDSDDKSSSGSSSGSVSPSDMFETVPIESKFYDMAEKLKATLSDIFDVFKKAWDTKGQSVIHSAKQSLNSLIDSIKTVGNTFYDVFTSGTGLTWVESCLELLRSMLGVVKSISDNFKNAWNSGAGIENVKALFGMLSNVNGLLSAIGDSFSRAFNNGVGLSIWKNLFGIITGVYNTIGNIANSIKIAWENSGVGDRIWSGILNIIDTVLGFIHNIVDATADWAANLDFYPLLESIAELLESISPVIEKIGDWLSKVYEKIILPVAKYIIEKALPTIINLLSKFFDFLGKNQWIIEAVGAALLGAFAASKIVPLISKIGGAVSGLIGKLLGGGGLKGAISGVVGALGGPLTVAIGAAIAAITLLVLNWDKVKAAMQKFDSWLQGVFSHDFTKEFGIFGDAINSFFANIKNLYESIKEILSGIIDFISGVFSGNWSKAWEGIKKIFSGVWNAMLAIVKSPINAIIGAINGLINGVCAGINTVIKALNKLHFKIPSWVPVFGGKEFGFNISQVKAPKIPYLATGAVIPPNKEFLAVLGDQKRGTNIEAPEALLRKIVREEMAGMNRGGGNYTFSAQLNRRVLFEEFIEEAKLRQGQAGKSPFAELI